MENRNCLIYGGGGFIGSHLCETLLAEGYNVRVFERIGFDKHNISHLTGKVEIIEGDFTNAFDIKQSLTDINYVYHLVSSTTPSISMDNPFFDVESNLIPTISLLQEILKLKSFKKIIFISSGGTVYGIPTSIPIPETHSTLPICSYGIVKNTIEHYLNLYQRLFGLKCNIFRLSNPYGERQNPFSNQGVIPVFLHKIISGEQIQIWGDGTVIRDYIYIKDVVRVLVDSLVIDTPNTIYNIGSGVGLSLNEIIDILRKVTNKDVNVNYLESRPFDVPINVLDIKLAKEDFNWNPNTNINQGVMNLYAYLKTIFIDKDC